MTGRLRGRPRQPYNICNAERQLPYQSHGLPIHSSHFTASSRLIALSRNSTSRRRPSVSSSAALTIFKKLLDILSRHRTVAVEERDDIIG